MGVIRYLTLTALALSIGSASAQASVITLHYDFSATNFLNAGAPVDPVTGSFSITFDNSSSTPGEVTTGLSVTGLNINFASPVGFTYNQPNDFLRIGSVLNGVGGFALGTDDFFLEIQDPSTNPTFLGFLYTQVGFSVYQTSDGAVTPAAVPEPAALTLLGFALVGQCVRRRRRRQAS